MVVKWLFRRFMALQVYVYRRSGGKRMGRVRGMPVLILTTVGRKTGKKRVNPVVYMRDGTNYVVVAANNGADEHPAWFLNLKGNPRITIEVDDKALPVIAHQATADDQARLWPQLVEKGPFFEGYKKKAKRDIPIVILEPVHPSAEGQGVR
jgi:F420H(2)-dependent quinone reductase